MTSSSTSSSGLAQLPQKLPWWGWLVGIGALLWAAGTALQPVLVLVLVAALIYQFTSVISGKK